MKTFHRRRIGLCHNVGDEFAHFVWEADRGWPNLPSGLTCLHSYRPRRSERGRWILGLEVQGAPPQGDIITLADGGRSERQLHAPTTGRLPRAVGGVTRDEKKVDFNWKVLFANIDRDGRNGPIENETIGHARFHATAERLGELLCERYSTSIILKSTETSFVETWTVAVRDW